MRLGTHLHAAPATALVSAYLAGLAAGRLAAGRFPLDGRLDVLLAWSLVMTLAGFAALWSTSSTPVAVAGVVIMGVAMSIHAPVGLARLFASAPGATQLASARSASGQGLAMLTCPPLLGALSDTWGLHRAALVFPVLLVLAWWAVRAAPVDRAPHAGRGTAVR